MAFRWGNRLFGISAPRLSRLVSDEGVLLLFDIRHPDALALTAPEVVGLVQQLAGDGRVIETQDGLLLSWPAVYELTASRDGDIELGLLGLPPVRWLVPCLRSDGTLTSPDFSIGIDGWRDEDNNPIGDVMLSGGLATWRNSAALIPAKSYRVVQKIREFHGVRHRNARANQRHWGELRRLAVEAGAILDEFLFSSIVLTPEKLAMRLRRTMPGGVAVVEIEPWFEGAPENWLTVFDQLPRVQDFYQIPTRDGIAQVIIEPKVRKVLEAIKTLEGRRVAGRLGEQFVANPFAIFGGDADDIIDADEFEQAREDAGIVFQSFQARVELNGEHVPTAVGIFLQSLSQTDPTHSLEAFKNPSELQKFINAVTARLERGQGLYQWRGHDIELQGNTQEQIDTLKVAYDEWSRPRVEIKFADVFDLTRYSDRIKGIGIQEPIVSAYIKRDKPSWFEGDEAPGGAKQPAVLCTVSTGDGRQFEAPITEEIASALDGLIAGAEKSGSGFIEWPESGDYVDVGVAREAVRRTKEAWGIKRDESETKKPLGPEQRRKELLLKANVNTAEYLETRAGHLGMVSDREARLPSSLSSKVKLFEHQRKGVAWLQNLIEQSPKFCRGAVLADDMGLGKTLQLLTVIARMLEDNPESPPVLVVAPVSLLENWRAEAETKFDSGTFRLLTLYGKALSAARATPSTIEETVREDFNSFLRPNWIRNANVVLTTYETLRDLEISFAATKWSLMVCDEAQRIKNPAAMVTRSAQKQNVGFRVACTGTPVENSLADLWCLFDYIQPGLLGALDEFGKRYRRPIECETDEQRARLEELDALVRPQILRRMKHEVAKDLKPKFEYIEPLPMSDVQTKLYSDALEQFRRRRERPQSSTFSSHLQLLQYLRMVCTDPRQVGRQVFVPEPTKEYRKKSPKLDWVITKLGQIQRLNEKVLLFCDFREIQRLLVYYIEAEFGYRPEVINGDTTTSAESEHSRQRRITAFQERPGFGVIILSPRAVGFGVNIQAANHVIHYMRSWNPAVENQATDRAYRIGQTKPVHVYYPIIKGRGFASFEEHLHKLIEDKKRLMENMFNGIGEAPSSEFNDILNVDEDVFEAALTIDDVVSFEPKYFEALGAALCLKRGYSHVYRTPGSGDDLVDVVARKGDAGELVQCKSSSVPGEKLGSLGVQNVVTGENIYLGKHPGVRFQLVCMTNQFFSESAKRLAAANGVRLIEQPDIVRLLGEYRLTMRDLEKFVGRVDFG